MRSTYMSITYLSFFHITEDKKVESLTLSMHMEIYTLLKIYIKFVLATV